MAQALLLGFVVGLPIAATPGPMFFLVLRRTLEGGWARGAVSGLGIATGDGIYAIVAAFGVSAALNLLVAQRRWIGFIGGIAILALGIRTLLRSPLPGASPRVAEGIWPYFSTLGLTLANPPTVLSFLAVFAGLGVRIHSGWAPSAALVVGVTLGSVSWWLLLTGTIASLRQRISSRVVRAIGLVSGLALIGFGGLITLQSL